MIITIERLQVIKTANRDTICCKIVQALSELKVIKLLRNLFVLKTGLNFRIFLRLRPHTIRKSRACVLCECMGGRLYTSHGTKSSVRISPCTKLGTKKKQNKTKQSFVVNETFSKSTFALSNSFK